MAKQMHMDAAKKAKPASKQDAGMQAKAHGSSTTAQSKPAMKSGMNKSESTSKMSK
ncbi:MAG: hypothetical protein JWQ42_497 [Edaphobacter sp.]|nr:hypothetical protein [Edaphobacter sp.]